MTEHPTWLVTARKRHYCEEYPRCPEGGISPGQEYIRTVAFPGDVTDHIWVMRLCVPCWTRHGRPLPDKRKASA